MSTPPTKSSWSRMRGAVRRASSVLIVAKPPSVTASDRDPDSVSIKPSSIKSITTNLLPSKALPSHAAPSPIAESPARENEATKDDSPPIALSPLSQSQDVAPSAPEPEATEASPEGYTPPPLIDSTATGPGGFTDDVDLLPQPQVVQDPFAPQAPGDPSPPADDVENPSVVPGPAPVVTLEPEPALIPEAVALVPTQPATPEPDLALPVANEPQELVPLPVTPEPNSYFDIPVVDEPIDNLPPSPPFKPTDGIQQADENPFLAEPSPIVPAETSRQIPFDVPFHPQTQSEPSMPQPDYNPPVISPSGIFPLPIPLSMPSFESSNTQDPWGGVTTKPIDGFNTRSIANGDPSIGAQPQYVSLFFKGDA